MPASDIPSPTPNVSPTVFHHHSGVACTQHLNTFCFAHEGKVKAKWGLLTDDDLMTIKGSRELLVGKIQERYGIAKDEARKQIDEYFASQGY